MAWKKTTSLFGITPEIRAVIEQGDIHAAFTANNISRQTELQVCINKHRSAWENWVRAKALIKASRDAWETAFEAYRQDGGSGPTVAAQLNELHQQEAALTREQQEAFATGNLEGAKAAFEALQDVVAKIRQLEETATNKQVSPAEASKQAAQKRWRQAQVVEADARNEHLIALALLLMLTEPLDEKGLKEFGRLLKNAPRVGPHDAPLFTDTDAVVPMHRFTLPEVGCEADDGGPDVEGETTQPDGSEESSTAS